MTQISATLPDGSFRALEDGATVATMGADIGSRPARDAVIGVIDWVEADLDPALADGQKVEIATDASEQGLHVMRHSYAAQVMDRVRSAGFRVDDTEATDPLGKRIRNAKTQKIPYVLVVGDDDVAGATVGVNPRGGDVERDVSVEDFVDRLTTELAETVGAF